MSHYSIKSEKYNINLDEVSDQDSFKVLSTTEDLWVVQYKNTIHECQILSFNPTTKAYTILVDNQKITFNLMDEVDRTVDAMGMNKVVTPVLDQLKAPMPGLVLNIRVSPGDEVVEGDTLLVLEAMKMENVIKATGEGTVKEIKVGKGDKVDKGQILIQF